MKKFRVFTLASILILSTMTLNAGINRVESGPCGNGRQWWSNTEYDDNGKATCVLGMDCSGNSYRLGCGPMSIINWGINIQNQSGSLHIAPEFDAIIIIFNTQTGNTVYSSGSAISSVNGITISTSGWSPGPYIIALYDPTTMIFSGSEQVLIY